MIPVDNLLYKIDQKLNKLSTNEHQQIPLEDKILALNEAQMILIKRIVTGVGKSREMGMDATKKRYEDLQTLIVDYKHQPLSLILKDKNVNQWVADLKLLRPTYMFYADSYVIADKGQCKDRIIWINSDLTKHGDLQFLLNNDNYKPSFEYQETFNSISSDEISIYTDGTFTPKNINIMYIRYPVYIDKEGYEKFDGSESVTTDCELESYLEDELLDIAVQSLAMYTENASAAQSAQFRIQTSD